MIHLGGDEYPNLNHQQKCPELVNYAKAHGYASTEDVFVAWQNQLAKVVESMGKRPEIWNWWDYVGHATIRPSTDFIIESWTGSPGAPPAPSSTRATTSWQQEATST